MERILLAAATDYLASWHLGVVLVVFFIWAVLGGHLLRRAVQPLVPRRKAAANRCYLAAFLATVAGAIGSSVVLVVAIDVLHRMLGQVATVQWLAPLLAAIGFVALTYVVLYASFDLSAAVALGVWLRCFGPPLALTVALGAPTALYTYSSRHRLLAEQHSLVRLRFIYTGLQTYGAGGTPRSLERMLDDNVLRKEDLQCRTGTDRHIDYFYLYSELDDRDPNRGTRLLACDFAENHGGRGRGALFADGKTRWCSAAEFSELLRRDENRAFALALKRAEEPSPKGQ